MTRKLLIFLGVMVILLFFATAGYARTPSSIGSWGLSADNPLPPPPTPRPIGPTPFPQPPPMEVL